MVDAFNRFNRSRNCEVHKRGLVDDWRGYTEGFFISNGRRWIFHDEVDSMKAIYITWGECTFLSRRLPIAGICPWFGPTEFLMLRYSPCRGYFYGRTRTIFPSPSFLPNILYHGHARYHAQRDPLLIMRPSSHYGLEVLYSMHPCFWNGFFSLHRR